MDRNSQRGNRAAYLLSLLSRLDTNKAAKRYGGDLALGAGRIGGVARGAYHSAQGLGDLAISLTPLAAPGQSAAERLVEGGRAVVGYAAKGVSDPQGVARDLREAGYRANVALNPAASPVADTLENELKRNFRIGQNQGELGFNIGSAIVGGPLAKRMNLPRAPVAAAKYEAQGFSPAAAEYMAEPYSRPGHHYFAERLKDKNLLFFTPEFFETEFNLLKPQNISRGDHYELHYQVDPYFHNANLKASLGKERWTGKALGLKKQGFIRRGWNGSPDPLKARIGGGAGAIGAAGYAGQRKDD